MFAANLDLERGVCMSCIITEHAGCKYSGATCRYQREIVTRYWCCCCCGCDYSRRCRRVVGTRSARLWAVDRHPLRVLFAFPSQGPVVTVYVRVPTFWNTQTTWWLTWHKKYVRKCTKCIDFLHDFIVQDPSIFVMQFYIMCLWMYTACARYTLSIIISTCKSSANNKTCDTSLFNQKYVIILL